MATRKQRQAAGKNVKKAQSAAGRKRTISNLSSETRSALGREGAKAAARKRGATKGTGTGAGAMTVTELRREAAKLGIDGRSKMGKAQLIRAVGQKRRSA
jgi:Rho termination factor, N-terminal domain